MTPANPSPGTRTTPGVGAVRIKLGPEKPAAQPDPLGRATVGYADGLSVPELWDRGRGVWKLRAHKVVDARLVLIAHNEVVRLVASIEGLTIHDDRLAILGTPLPDHPLIGQPDPLHNDSRNPITYGRIAEVSSP